MSEPLTVRLHPEATAEVRSAYWWYQARGLEAASSFIAEIDQAIERLQDMPGIGAPHDLGTRRLMLRQFPYGLIYRDGPGGIEVLAVAHASREPGYWKDRR